jgi:D-amino-acid oxidase
MTTALCLSEAGMNVRIVADRPHRLTTSAVAGALWGRYVSDDPRVLDWSVNSLPDLAEVSRDDTSGVRFSRGVEAARTAVDPPAWLHRMTNFALCAPADLPPKFSFGWTYSAPVFDMPVYLDYLFGRLVRSGVRIDILDIPLRSLHEVVRDAEIVINCTGLGSRKLVPDAELTAAWGQLVVVENPGIDGFFSDFPESEEPTYFIAHHDHVILGGIVSHSRTDTQPDRDAADRIIERCSAVEPRLGRSPILDYRLGLRPVRPRVRLERKVYDGTLIVHNYGHGGSGVTLSWGCARQVQALIG